MSAELKAADVPVSQLRVSHPVAGNIMGRGLKLWLDDEELTPLKAGQALTVEIEPGAHRLRAHNTYHARTVEFVAAPGEQVHYRINNRVGFFGWFMLTVLGGGPMHLAIERADPVESTRKDKDSHVNS
ncbi:MAG TPA: hypothetical protein VF546_10750 [Pyrinomonadaceae bacterium]|jgi:hypothetical protein